METYSFLRELADSWVLLAMFCFFISAVLWAFRPGGSKTYDEISQIPLRNDQPELRTETADRKNGEASMSPKGEAHV